ncbi:MAG: gamma-glutamyltransferase [Planctomycetes bacterium]|nr:gamma-glutamyltransferase [Planctomycetota bacterium]
MAPTISRCAVTLLNLFLVALPACSINNNEMLDAGMVVAPEPHAAKVGADILRRGGNAVDAAVAVQFALAVTYPTAGNIGGGGFMLLHAKNGDQIIDCRETAPAAASRDMYLDSTGNVDAKASLQSHRAAGVPGTVRGMWEAHKRYGCLKWRELLQPAITLAADGFDLDPWTANSFAEQSADIAKREPRFRDVCNFATYFHGKPGERLRQPELAETLRSIADQGPDGFYEGRTADLILSEMKRGGGLITRNDLRTYTVKWRAPLEFTHRGNRIVTVYRLAFPLEFSRS